MHSRRKRNVNYIKPLEPVFLSRLKQQTGYIEDSNIDTKKEKLALVMDEEFEDREDEKPTVVKQHDDLSEIKLKVKKQDKADLNQKVIFKKKKDNSLNLLQSVESRQVKKIKKEKKIKTVLSFNIEDEE